MPKIHGHCVGAMSHTEVKPDYTQENQTDFPAPLTIVDQQANLESERLQVRGQVNNQTRALVRELIESGVIF